MGLLVDASRWIWLPRNVKSEMHAANPAEKPGIERCCCHEPTLGTAKNKPQRVSSPLSADSAKRREEDASLTGCWISGTAFSTERCIPNGMLQKGDGIFRYETTLLDWLVAPRTRILLRRFRQTPLDHPCFMRCGWEFLRWKLI